MEQDVGAGLAPAQQKGDQQTAGQESAVSRGGVTPHLQEIDRLRLERLNLSIGNLNLQLALLNERARALQIETAGFRAEREGLAKGITESYGLDGRWRFNPDRMEFEENTPPAPLTRGETPPAIISPNDGGKDISLPSKKRGQRGV